MRSLRFLCLLAAPVLMLSGCKSALSLSDHMASVVGLGDDVPQSYDSSEVSVAQHNGMVVADEPLAARAGAAALASHGNAVDAVTTMFFTMAATYPVAAGLGGGGICLVSENGAVSEYDFLARTPRGGGAYAVPGAVHGFFDMQKDRGTLPWQRDVAPGEAYAATGFPISQALAERLTAAQGVIRLDAALASQFLDESGQPKAAGVVVSNQALAQTLGSVRLGGADGFYKSDTAARIATYAVAQGGTVTMTDMVAMTATQSVPHASNIGGVTAWLPGPATGAGAFTSALLNNLSSAQRGGQGTETATGIAVRQTLASFGVTALPGDMGSTGFAAVDANGQAAACAVTLNGPFGSGHTAAATGVVLAASPAGPVGLAGAFLTPVIAINGNGVALAGAGAGGPNGTAAAAYALLQAAGGRRLGRRGDLRTTGAAPYDTVNMISCDGGVCVALADPGAHGLGAAADLGQ